MPGIKSEHDDQLVGPDDKLREIREALATSPRPSRISLRSIRATC